MKRKVIEERLSTPVLEVEYTEKDLSMLKRAGRERWDIRPELRESLLKKMETIITDGDGKPENAIKAASVIRSLDALNLKEEEIRTPNVNINVNVGELSDLELRKHIEQLAADLKLEQLKTLPIGESDKEAGQNMQSKSNRVVQTAEVIKRT